MQFDEHAVKKLSRVAPKWAKEFKDANKMPIICFSSESFFRSTGLDISNPEFCVVGEANGFTSLYHSIENGEVCPVCLDASYSIIPAVDDVIFLGDNKRFVAWVDEFVAHIEEVTGIDNKEG